MSGAPDPERLLADLQAGAPGGLEPLRLAAASPSARPGPAGRIVGAARAALLRLLAPQLGDLLVQLERDRRRTHAELAALRERLAALEPPSQA